MRPQSECATPRPGGRAVRRRARRWGRAGKSGGEPHRSESGFHVRRSRSRAPRFPGGLRLNLRPATTRRHQSTPTARPGDGPGAMPTTFSRRRKPSSGETGTAFSPRIRRPITRYATSAQASTGSRHACACGNEARTPALLSAKRSGGDQADGSTGPKPPRTARESADDGEPALPAPSGHPPRAPLAYRGTEAAAEAPHGWRRGRGGGRAVRCPPVLRKDNLGAVRPGWTAWGAPVFAVHRRARNAWRSTSPGPEPRLGGRARAGPANPLVPGPRPFRPARCAPQGRGLEARHRAVLRKDTPASPDR